VRLSQRVSAATGQDPSTEKGTHLPAGARKGTHTKATGSRAGQHPPPLTRPACQEGQVPREHKCESRSHQASSLGQQASPLGHPAEDRH
jgi:hypothetical protein